MAEASSGAGSTVYAAASDTGALGDGRLMRFGVILFFALGLTALGGCKLLESGDADPDAALAPAPVLGPEIPVVLFQPEPGLTNGCGSRSICSRSARKDRPRPS